MLSPANTGDGDLGLFAMESRSPSISFDHVDDETHSRDTQADHSHVPTHPMLMSSVTASRISAAGRPVPTNGTRGVATFQSMQDPSNTAPPASNLPSSLTSSAVSSRLGGLSLQDELSQQDTGDSGGASSTTSPTSATSTSTRDLSHAPSKSVSSSGSAYTSAAESPASDAAADPSLPAPAPAAPTPSQSETTSAPHSSSLPSSSISQQSIASASTITHARLPTLRSLSSGLSADKQAMSLEQELDANAESESSSVAATGADHPSKNNALSRRSSRRRRRSGLPALQDRLPVGAGGPQAPPRNASFRDASKRLSTGQGYGDLGVDAYAPSGVGPSSPSMTSFLDLDSPRSSESSTNGRYPVPSRRTSLRASSPNAASQPLDHLGSASDTRKGTSTAAATSSASPFIGAKIASRPASRPTSSGSKAALLGASTSTKPDAAASKTTSKIPVSKPSLDREAMQRWVLSVGCVNFDLELGPDLEFLYPPLGISREERDNIAFSSFPDTSIFDDGSLVFSWRVREVPLDSSKSEPPTIKSLNDALPQPPSLADEETPRPSMNKAALQNAMAVAQAQKIKAAGAPHDSSLPTSPVSPSTPGFRDSSASSAASSQSLSRQASDANLRSAGSGLPATTSFHERLTQKLFSSSGSSSMARHFSHDRHSSAHSASSASASADDEGEAAAATSSGGASTRAAGSNASPSSSSISATTNSSFPTSDLIHPKRTAGNSTSSSYIYGYVYFRQKRDPTNRRGYFQKSVVILSHLPLVGLFSEVVSRLGPLYFEHGMSMFESFANDIMAWPTPQPGTILTLPLLGSLITAAIPFGQQPQNSPNADSAAMVPSLSGSSTGSGGFRGTATMTIRSRSRQASANGSNSRELPEPLIGPEGPLLASIPATSLFETFKEALADLWLLWECVLLAEPILVIAPEPKIASEAVWHMLDLIRPIPYAGDFRPYFHIHDYDFRTLVTKNKPQAGTLIASTNPFFATACGHWPHVLRVGKAAVKLITIKGGAGGVKKGVQGAGIGGGHGAGGGGPDHVPGFTTKRKRRVSKDRQLLKRLQDLAVQAGRGDEAAKAAVAGANVTMRRYFADLTERFLAPLNRYVASLVPASFDLSSPSEVPKIRPFNTNDFLASLKAHGTPLAIRSRSLPTGASVRQGLYLDFLRCPNFSLWLHSRVAAAEEEQRRRYIASLLQGDVAAYGRSKGEIETVDLYSRLVEEIRLVDVQLTAPTEPGPGSRWRTDKPRDRTKAESGRSTPTLTQSTEKRLREQKVKLMAQLERLCLTLPDDLRVSLRRPG